MAPNKPKAAERATIVLACADAEVRAPLRRMLEHAGYRVQTTRDGRAAPARVGPAGPALLVLAGQGACSDGLDACRRLRIEGTAAETPLLWLTPPGDVSMRLAAPYSARRMCCRCRLNRRNF